MIPVLPQINLPLPPRHLHRLNPGPRARNMDRGEASQGCGGLGEDFISVFDPFVVCAASVFVSFDAFGKMEWHSGACSESGGVAYGME